MSPTARTVTLRTLLFALVHTILASNWSKQQFENVFGRRARNGLYRFCYENLSVLSVVILFWSFTKLPDKVVYRVSRPWSLLMRLGQLFGLWLILDTNLRMGVGRFTGMSGVLDLIKGREPSPEPPAQGPRLEADPSATGGAFRLSRHPNNLGPTLIACLQPTMTETRLTFAIIGSLYAVFGSILEERRARASYGPAYDAYRSRVPYFFPLPRLRKRRASPDLSPSP